VLQILAIGVLINSVAHVPFSLLQGVGRPDLVAKAYLLELVIHLGLSVLLIGRFGAVGAASAWGLRALVDAALLFGLSYRICGIGWQSFAAQGMRRVLICLASALAVAVVAVWVLRRTPPGVTYYAAAIILPIASFAIWIAALNVADRGRLRTLVWRAVPLRETS
jgi:O-antigen/teichoic acid export membrane protein